MNNTSKNYIHCNIHGRIYGTYCQKCVKDRRDSYSAHIKNRNKNLFKYSKKYSFSYGSTLIDNICNNTYNSSDYNTNSRTYSNNVNIINDTNNVTDINNITDTNNITNTSDIANNHNISIDNNRLNNIADSINERFNDIEVTEVEEETNIIIDNRNIPTYNISLNELSSNITHNNDNISESDEDAPGITIDNLNNISRVFVNELRYDQCSICLNSFTTNNLIRTLPCNHQFHMQCIDSWLITKNTCPLCKKIIK